MRGRVLRVALAAVVIAGVILGIPLGYAAAHLVRVDEQTRLEQLVLRSALTVSPGYRSGDPIELPAVGADITIGVYDVRGRLVTGAGPPMLEPETRATLRGRALTADVGEDLVSTVPVAAGESVIAVVRASTPESAVHHRILLWLLALAGAELAAGLIAAAFAAWQSRRLARPLVTLAGSATALGEGDFTARSTPAGIPEIDAVGSSLDRTAGRLADLIERERGFSAHASHQLRTPLTQLQLQLELGLERDEDGLREAALAAMATADRLTQTVDDVLALARPGRDGSGIEIEALLEECRETWQGVLARAGRPLHVALEERVRAGVSLEAARQALDVLIDNAFRHGTGAVTVTARRTHGAVAIDVGDEGRMPADLPDVSATGLGLPLARSLLTVEGGRLVAGPPGEPTRWTVLLPVPGDGSVDG